MITKRIFWGSAIIIILSGLIAGCQNSPKSNRDSKKMTNKNIVFATYIESAEQLPVAYRLAESIRSFGGRSNDAPIWIYHPEDIAFDGEADLARFSNLDVEFRTSQTPDKAKWFFYGGKPYAAAKAETQAAADKTAILIYMDPDTILLMEPSRLFLEPEISLAYRPVMHNRSGSLLEKPADPFWSRIYQIGSVSENMLFPMTTHADKQKVRAYFHCGLLSLRPEKGILKKWADDFDLLIQDSLIVEMCKEDIDKRIFLHQNALTGAVLNTIPRKEMIELSDKYNYPIFFEKQYGALEPFNSIEGVVTIRCVVSPDNMGSEWYQQLKGPKDKKDWLRERLMKSE